MAENKIKIYTKPPNIIRIEKTLEKERILIEDYFRLRHEIAELDEKLKELDEKLQLLNTPTTTLHSKFGRLKDLGIVKHGSSSREKIVIQDISEYSEHSKHSEHSEQGRHYS